MAGETLPRIHTLPTRTPLVRPSSPLRNLLTWGVGAALLGALIGIAIQVAATTLTDAPFDWWFVQMSVFTAEAITLSALVGTRYAFPHFEHLPVVARYGLILLTLVGGAIFATALSLTFRAGVLFSRPTQFLSLAAANTVLALLIGGALITYERLKGSLERAYDELRVKEAFEREMSVARDVQQQLLPECAPTLPGYELAYCCRPAALVGGDTFDFLELPEGRLVITVGDVVGKGIAASLLMASVQSLTRGLAPRERDAAKVLEILSEAIGHPRSPGRLVTYAWLALEPQSGELEVALAGHHPPMIVGAAGVREVEAVGLPLGVNIGIEYETRRERLAPGETCVVFTDGLLEAPAERDEDEEFGKERIAATVRRLGAGPAKETLEALLDAYVAHTGSRPAADDMTIVVIRRLPEGAGEASS